MQVFLTNACSIIKNTSFKTNIVFQNQSILAQTKNTKFFSNKKKACGDFFV